MIEPRDPTPCYEAYLTSGLSQQRMTFEEFRDLYSDDLCAMSGPSTEEAGADQVNARDTHPGETCERRDVVS
jgi:hypothetical protein